MSEYVKKVFVFDEVLQGFAQGQKKVSGVLKVQKDDKKCVAMVYITNLNRNLADKIECVLLVGKKIYLASSESCQFEISIEQLSQFDDVACLVCANQDVACVPVAFATNNKCILVQDLSKHIANCNQPTQYEEFICATDNYFDDENFDIEQIKQKSISKFRPIEMLAAIKPTDNKSFFANAKETLLQIFDTYPPCDELNSNLPDSFWVKVPFKKEKYFGFGIIQQEGKPKHIAYAVPGKKASPPDDKSFAFFATKNKEVGFWVICQDANTGFSAEQPYFWL